MSLERGEQSDSAACLANQFQKSFEHIFRRQFNQLALFVVISTAAFMAAYGFIALRFQRPANPEFIKQLQESNQNLAKLAQVLAQSGQAPQAASAIAAQMEAHEQAVAALQRTARDMPPQAVSFLQLLGGTTVLALLGYLGLLRLQNIDSEIQSLREFMFKQIKERIEEGRDVLRSSIDEEVDERYRSTKEDIQRLVGEFQKSAESATERADAVEERVTALLKNYSWLNEKEVRGAADQISHLASAGQANTTAGKFNGAGDQHMARLALRQIGEKHLPGSSDDFHNAHSGAMRSDDPQLALIIAEEGLQRFPDHYDLMADKARALLDLGRRTEALALLQEWRKRKPTEFARGWRPVVFYADLLKGGDLADPAVLDLEKIFEDVTSRLPYEAKPWSAWAQFEQALGQDDRAEKALVDGLSYNPFSQELNFVLGELLLSRGRARESVEYLRKSLQFDLADQFQSAVSQDAVRATYAQALEATGDSEEAEKQYRLLLNRKNSNNVHVRQYVENRLRAIAALRGEEAQIDEESEEGLREMLEFLAQKAAASDATPKAAAAASAGND